jgi:methylmalonyl-CoA decarboxylase subunit alpha
VPYARGECRTSRGRGLDPNASFRLSSIPTDPRFGDLCELRAEYSEEIDILHLASELVIDAVVQPADLRRELIKRFAAYASRDRTWPAKRNPITPA